MRTSCLSVCLALVGCGSTEVDMHSLVNLAPGMLEPTVTLPVETHGIHVPDGDSWGAAGMGGAVTCQIDMETGVITTDVDLLVDEDVVDGVDGTVLACDDSRHCVTADFPSGDPGEGWTMPEGGTSRLLDGGHVELGVRGDQCGLEFRGDRTAGIRLPAAYCERTDAFAVADDVAWVGSAGSLVRATADGFDERPLASRLLAADRTTGIVLVGDPGSDVVFALDADGGQLWTQSFGAGVAGLDVHAGRAVIVVQDGRFESTLVVVDAASGAIASRQAATNLTPGSVAISDAFVVVTNPEQFDFLRFTGL